MVVFSLDPSQVNLEIAEVTGNNALLNLLILETLLIPISYEFPFIWYLEK